MGDRPVAVLASAADRVLAWPPAHVAQVQIYRSIMPDLWFKPAVVEVSVCRMRTLVALSFSTSTITRHQLVRTSTACPQQRARLPESRPCLTAVLAFGSVVPTLAGGGGLEVPRLPPTKVLPTA